MWYVVDMLFAQKARPSRRRVLCETCSVLFQAPSALAACRKAAPWAKAHAADAGFYLVGIVHVRSLDDDHPGDGTEVGGGFCEKLDPWRRRKQLVPKLTDIPLVRWESHPDTPIKDLAPKATLRRLRKVVRRR